MKKLLFFLVIATFFLCGCKKESSGGGGSTPNVPMEQIYGSWVATQIFYNGEWIPASGSLSFSATINEDKTYSTSGYFYSSGTYKVSGNNIDFYEDTYKVATLYFTSLDETNAEIRITVFDDPDVQNLRAKLMKVQY